MIGRRYKNDLSDIVGILAEHESRGTPITRDAISEAVENLYDGWDRIGEKSVDFIHAILENGKYREIYDAIRKNENNTKSALMDFREKYPGVLNADKLDEVIDKTTDRNGKTESAQTVLERLKNREKE